MKKLLALLFLLPSLGWAADLTASVNTEGNQLYNRGYRDVKDGTNALTNDVVSANSYTFTATTTTVKSSAGYLEGIQYWKTCAEVIGVLDGGVAISTAPASFAAAYVPYKVRFGTSLVVNIPAACTSGVTVSYR